MAKTKEPEIKAKSDAYTGILFISLLAMIGACVLLYLDYDSYSSRTPPATPKIDVPNPKASDVPSKARPTETPKDTNPMPTSTETTPKDTTPKDPMKMTLVPPKSNTNVVSKPLIDPLPMVPEKLPPIEIPLTITTTNPEIKVPSPKVIEPVIFDPMSPTKTVEDVKPVKNFLEPPTLLDEPPVRVKTFIPEK